MLAVFTFSSLRAELLTLYENVILTDIEFSDTQNVDQLLWKNVFYQVIERFRQILKNQDSDTAPQIRTMLLTLLEEVRDLTWIYYLFFIAETCNHLIIYIPTGVLIMHLWFSRTNCCCYVWLILSVF